MAMIQARALTKRYGGIVAVDNLSFDVFPGRVTALLGPNGAGKSTALRLMLDLERGRGETLYDGRRYRRLRRPGAEVGACVGLTGAHPGRRVRAHLRMLAAAGRIPARRVDEVLDLVGLTPVAGARVRVLSAGALGRLGLAGALLGDPRTLVLDEPAAGLDPQGVRWLRDFLRAFADDGRTVLVAGHILAETARCADRVLVISRGRLVADEPAADFLRRGAQGGVSVRTPQVARLSALLQAEGLYTARSGGTMLTVTGVDRARVGEIAFRGGILLHELTEREPGVGDAFTDVITMGRERPQTDQDEDSGTGHSTGIDSASRPTEELAQPGSAFTHAAPPGPPLAGPAPSAAPGSGLDPDPDPPPAQARTKATPPARARTVARSATTPTVAPAGSPTNRDTAASTVPEAHRIIESGVDPDIACAADPNARVSVAPHTRPADADADADVAAGARRSSDPDPNEVSSALPPRGRFARTWRSTGRAELTDEVRSA
ncbi:ABC transporter ATP-binding protein [Embleya scabrispora]|uniref:ABC transporter ATP-binding protein n=1 Tax=Embleya scabrispora TaxID=159449 RepID=UPI001FDF3232|nr:ATP-binding cassette domain-containing protein [Embleya scabrispora]